MRIGNDVVDFREQVMVGSRLDRALRKICSPVELSAIEGLLRGLPAAEAFWRMWSAKETAYKIVSKRVPQLRFNPMSYQVVVPGDGTPRERGKVRSALEPALTVDVRWESLEGGVHCIGADLPGWEGRSEWAVAEDGDHTARALASAIGARFGIQGARVERMPASVSVLGPPGLLDRDGKPVANADVSLSGHGRFSAAAIAFD